MHTRRRLLLAGAAVLAAALLAALWARIAVRTPALWPLVPEPFLQGLVTVLEPRGQEAVAGVEWLGFWLVGFVLLLLVGLALLGAWRLRARDS